MYHVDGTIWRSRRTMWLLALAVCGCVTSGAKDVWADDSVQYRAEIRWTSYGIPHILADYALAFKDANENNYGLPDTWLAMDRATSLDEFKEVIATHHSFPWVYVEAVSREGEVFYVDASAVPFLGVLRNRRLWSC